MARDELGERVERDRRGTGDNEIGTFPRPLIGQERLLFGHPLTQALNRPRPSRLPDPGQAPARRFPLIGLHPDERVHQVRGFAAPGTNSLDDEQRAAGRHIDGSLAAVLSPARRLEGHRLAAVHGHQDPIDQQVGPAEAGVPPGEVIGVHDR